MSTGKTSIIYEDDSVDEERVGKEKVWSFWSEAFTRQFSSSPDPEIIPCSSLELPRMQQEQPWIIIPSQASQDPAESKNPGLCPTTNPGSAEQPAEKINKRGRSSDSTPEIRYRCSTASMLVRNRARHTPAVSRRRPSQGGLAWTYGNSPRKFCYAVLFTQPRKE
jgi:hypothetical protein